MAESKQQIIIEAAKKLFGEKGYQATSVRDIAEAASSNIASITYYFGGKEELFRTVVRDCLKDTSYMFHILNERPKDIGELKMLLRNFLKLFCTMRSENPNCFFMLSRNMDLIVELDPVSFEEHIWKLKESLGNVIKLAQKDKLLKKGLDPKILATIIMSALSHLLKDEKVSCKFAGVSVLEEPYRTNYINHIVDCCIDGSKEMS